MSSVYGSLEGGTGAQPTRTQLEALTLATKPAASALDRCWIISATIGPGSAASASMQQEGARERRRDGLGLSGGELQALALEAGFCNQPYISADQLGLRVTETPVGRVRRWPKALTILPEQGHMIHYAAPGQVARAVDRPMAPASKRPTRSKGEVPRTFTTSGGVRS